MVSREGAYAVIGVCGKLAASTLMWGSFHGIGHPTLTTIHRYCDILSEAKLPGAYIHEANAWQVPCTAGKVCAVPLPLSTHHASNILHSR